MSEVIRCPDAHQTMWRALGDKDYREAFAEAHVGDFLASQIYSMRLAKGWTQAQLADEAGVTQPMICDFEKSVEGVRLTSLFKVASAFDVALLVKFVPFHVMAREAIDVRADQPVPSFEDDSQDAVGFGSVRTFPSEPRTHAKPRNGGSNGYLRSVDPLASSPSVRASQG